MPVAGYAVVTRLRPADDAAGFGATRSSLETLVEPDLRLEAEETLRLRRVGTRSRTSW